MIHESCIYVNKINKIKKLTIHIWIDVPVPVREVICLRPNVVCLVNLKRLGSIGKKRKREKVELVVVLHWNINAGKTICLFELNDMLLVLNDVSNSNTLFYYFKLPFATWYSTVWVSFSHASQRLICQ